jgi:hypothetical protein
MTPGHPEGRPRCLELKTTFETSQTDTHGIGSARSLCLKSSSQKKPSQYCDTALMRHPFRNECIEANFGAVSDTPTTCPVRFPLQPPRCPTAWTDPYVRLASACLGTQRTGPFRYRGRRRERISEQPYGSRIRHEDETNVSAISMRILQTP